MSKHFAVATVCFLLISARCLALTVDDAMSLAEKNLPSYRASQLQERATDALYDASLSPYLPRLDATTIQERREISSSQERIARSSDSFDVSSYDVTLSYTLFDGGKRRADRNIARLNLEIDKEDVERNLLQLRFDVTSAFYAVVARNEILEHRKVQQYDAQKDYEVAQGRHNFGLVKLSDMLQASVRLEQARFSRIQAEGDLKNGLSDLNSLLGRPLDSPYDLEGSLTIEPMMVELDKLVKSALERPEIKQAEHSIDISENNKASEKSAFFPVVTANASYNRVEGGTGGGGTNEDKSIGITATWNFF